MDVSPAMRAAQARAADAAHQLAMQRRALAARDADVTPAMRRSTAMRVRMIRWEQLLELTGGHMELAQAAERRLDEVHGDVAKAVERARVLDQDEADAARAARSAEARARLDRRWGAGWLDRLVEKGMPT